MEVISYSIWGRLEDPWLSSTYFHPSSGCASNTMGQQLNFVLPLMLGLHLNSTSTNWGLTFLHLGSTPCLFVSAGQQRKQHEPFCCWFKCILSLLSNILIVSYSCNYDILVLHQAKTQPCFHGPRGNLNHSFTHLCYVGGERGEELDFLLFSTEF